MTLRQFLEEKKRQRRDFLLGAGTLIALPFFESLYAKNLYAADKAPLRVLFGHIDTGVDQIGGNGYAHQSVLDMFNPIKNYTNFYYNIQGDVSGARHPGYIQDYATGGGGTSFDHYAQEITGSGTLPGVLAIAINGRLAQTNDWKISKKNGKLSTPLNNMSSILKSAVITGGGAVTNPNPGTPVLLDRQTQLKKMSLDYVVDSINDLKRKLSPSDKRILDEHLTQIESIEARLPREPADVNPKDDNATLACIGVNGVKDNVTWQERHDLLADMIAMSFICDSRRSISVAGNDGRRNPGYENFIPIYKELLSWIKGKVQAGGGEDKSKPDYHLTTHIISGDASFRNAIISKVGGGEDGAKNHMRKVRREIDKFNVSLYIKVAQKLQAAKDVNDKSVLENSLIYFGGDMGDATVHSKFNLFTATIGGAGGRISMGRNKVGVNSGKITAAFQYQLLKALGHTGTSMYSHKGNKRFGVDMSIFKG